MPQKADEHHKHAAKHHHDAAKHHASGTREKAAHHALVAHAYTLQADHHAGQAAKSHTEEHSA
jgi:hypothetical protein